MLAFFSPKAASSEETTLSKSTTAIATEATVTVADTSATNTDDQPTKKKNKKSGSWWSKLGSKPSKDHEGLAHSIKDIIMGEDHAMHTQKRKRAVKALQHPETANSILNYLKAMPDPKIPTVEVDHPDDLMSDPDVAPLSSSLKEKNKMNDKDSLESNKKQEPISEKLKTASQKLVVTVDKLLKFHPPKHRISAYVFWWGYEIYVPQECMGRLDQAQNVGGSFLGLLQVVAGNVGALHPYFGFISAWVGLQFTIIKLQNAGNGVVLAATWVLPVALIPRPWDAPLDDD